MDHLQVLKLPSMAKFNAGFVHCNRSFVRDCVGPARESYERRMSKVCPLISIWISCKKWRGLRGSCILVGSFMHCSFGLISISCI
jgi:hypothetical protein